MSIKWFDPVRYFESRGVQYWDSGPNCQEGWVNIQCLFCDDHSNHLGINLSTKFFNCWKCNAKGPVTRIIKIIERTNNHSKIEEILETFRTLRSATEKQIEYSTICSPPKGMKSLDQANNLVLEFAEKRGIPFEILKENAIGFTDHTNFKYGWRIIFPITVNGRLYSFVGRDYTGKQKIKYKNCLDADSIIPAWKLLYGFDDLPYNGVCILVEGIIDKIKLGTHTAATLGSIVVPEQIRLLQEKNPKKVFFLFDSELEAQKLAIQASKMIWFCPSECIVVPEYSDPGEMSIEEGRKLVWKIVNLA